MTTILVAFGLVFSGWGIGLAFGVRIGYVLRDRQLRDWRRNP